MSLQLLNTQALLSSNLPSNYLNLAVNWTFVCRFKVINSLSGNNDFVRYKNHLWLVKTGGAVQFHWKDQSNLTQISVVSANLNNWHTMTVVADDQAANGVEVQLDGSQAWTAGHPGTLRNNARTDPIVMGDENSGGEIILAEVGFFIGAIPAQMVTDFHAGSTDVRLMRPSSPADGWSPAATYLFNKHVEGSFYDENGDLRWIQTSNTNTDGFVSEPFSQSDAELEDVSGGGYDLSRDLSEDGATDTATVPTPGWVNDHPGDVWTGGNHDPQVRWPTGDKWIRLLQNPAQSGNITLVHTNFQTTGLARVGFWNVEGTVGRNPDQATVDNKYNVLRPKMAGTGISILGMCETLNHPSMVELNNGEYPYVLTSTYSRPSRHVADQNFFFFDVTDRGNPYWNEGNNFGLGIWDNDKQIRALVGLGGGSIPTSGTFEGQSFSDTDPYSATIKYPFRFEHALFSKFPIRRHYQLEFVRIRQGRDDSPPKEFPSIAGTSGCLVAEVDILGKSLVVALVHLDAGVNPDEPPDEDRWNRRYVIQNLVEWLEDGPLAINPDTDPVVIMGDFNAETDPAAPGGLPGGTGSRSEWQSVMHDAGFRNAWIGVDHADRLTKGSTCLDHIYTRKLGDTELDAQAFLEPNTKDETGGAQPWGTPNAKPDHGLIWATLNQIQLFERENVRVTQDADEEWWWSWQTPLGDAVGDPRVREFVRKGIGASDPTYDAVANASRYVAEASNLGYTNPGAELDVAWLIQNYGVGDGAEGNIKDDQLLVLFTTPAGVENPPVKGYYNIWIEDDEIWLYMETRRADDSVYYSSPNSRFRDFVDQTIGGVATIMSLVEGFVAAGAGDYRSNDPNWLLTPTNGLVEVLHGGMSTITGSTRAHAPALFQNWGDGVAHLTRASQPGDWIYDREDVSGASDPPQWFKTFFMRNGMIECKVWMDNFIAEFKRLQTLDSSIADPVRAHFDYEDIIAIGGVNQSNLYELFAAQQADPRYDEELLPGVFKTLEQAYIDAGSPAYDDQLDFDDPLNQAFNTWFEGLAWEVMDGALEIAAYRPLRQAFPNIMCSNYHSSASYSGNGGELDYWKKGDISDVKEYLRPKHVGSGELQAEVYYWGAAKYGAGTRPENDLATTQELVGYNVAATGKGGEDLSPWIHLIGQVNDNDDVSTQAHMTSKVDILRQAGCREFLIWNDGVYNTVASWNQMYEIITTTPTPPINLQVQVINWRAVQLTWQDPVNVGGVIYYAETSPDGVNWTRAWLTKPTFNDPDYVDIDRGLIPNTTYFFRVRSFKDGRVSEVSNIEQATTAEDPMVYPVFVLKDIT